MAELPKLVRAQLGRKAERETGGPGAPETLQSGFHPDANLLSAFAERTLAPRERDQLLDHLAECAPCRELVALAFPAPEVQADVADLAGAETSRGYGSRLPSWLRWPTVRWGVLTASVGIILAGAFREGVLHRPRSERTARQTVAELAPSSPVMVPSPAPAGAAPPASNAPTPAPRAENKQLALARKTGVPPSLRLRAPLASASREDQLTIGGGAAGLQSDRADTSGGLQSRQAVTAGGAQASVRRDEKVQAALTAPVPPVSAEARFAAAEPSPAKPSMETPRAKDGLALAEKKTAPLAQEAASEAVREADKGAAQVPPGVTSQNGSPAPAPPEERAESNEVVRQKAGAAGRETIAGALLSRPSRGASASNQVAGPLMGKATTPLAAYWTISAAGKLERSQAAGGPWRPVSVDDSVTFRAVTADGASVWAGGSGGALYHSTDGGETWTRVRVGPNQSAGQPVVTAAIVSVKFSDALHGVIATAGGEIWTTADGGAHWATTPAR